MNSIMLIAPNDIATLATGTRQQGQQCTGIASYFWTEQADYLDTLLLIVTNQDEDNLDRCLNDLDEEVRQAVNGLIPLTSHQLASTALGVIQNDMNKRQTKVAHVTDVTQSGDNLFLVLSNGRRIAVQVLGITSIRH